MFHSVIYFFLFMLSVILPAPQDRDCLDPKGIASLLIDQDPELSRMAKQTAQLYKWCMDCSSASLSSDLLCKSQYEWTRDLKDCKSGACLTERYRCRIEYLREYFRWASEIERGNYENVENLLPCKRGW